MPAGNAIGQFVTGLVGGMAGAYTNVLLHRRQQQSKFLIDQTDEAIKRGDIGFLESNKKQISELFGNDAAKSMIESAKGNTPAARIQQTLPLVLSILAGQGQGIEPMVAPTAPAPTSSMGSVAPAPPSLEPPQSAMPTTAPVRSETLTQGQVVPEVQPSPAPIEPAPTPAPQPQPTQLPQRRVQLEGLRIGEKGGISINLKPEEAKDYATRLFMQKVLKGGKTTEKAEQELLDQGLVAPPEIVKAVGERRFNKTLDATFQIVTQAHPNLPVGNRLSLAASLAVQIAGSEYAPSSVITQLLQQRANLPEELQSKLIRMGLDPTTVTAQQAEQAFQGQQAEEARQIGREALARETARLQAQLTPVGGGGGAAPAPTPTTGIPSGAPAQAPAQPAPSPQATTLGGAVTRQEAEQRRQAELAVPERAAAGERQAVADFLTLNEFAGALSKSNVASVIGPFFGRDFVNTALSSLQLSSVEQQEARADLFKLTNMVTRIRAGLSQTEGERQNVINEAPTPTDTVAQYFGKLRSSLTGLKTEAKSRIAVFKANNILIPKELDQVPESVDKILKTLPGAKEAGKGEGETIRSKSKSGKPIVSTDGGKTWRYE